MTIIGITALRELITKIKSDMFSKTDGTLVQLTSVDSTPTQGSTNLVTSGGVYNATSGNTVVAAFVDNDGTLTCDKTPSQIATAITTSPRPTLEVLIKRTTSDGDHYVVANVQLLSTKVILTSWIMQNGVITTRAYTGETTSNAWSSSNVDTNVFSPSAIGGYDATKTQTLRHVNGSLLWVDEPSGEYYMVTSGGNN